MEMFDKNVCDKCGFFTNELFIICCSSFGKIWREKYCLHCYELEKYSGIIPCKETCEKCKHILDRNQGIGE